MVDNYSLITILFDILGDFFMRLNYISDDIALLCGGFSDVFIDDSASTVDEINSHYKSEIVQLIDSNYIAGILHLEMIGHQICESKKRNNSYSNNLELDILLRIACDRRISKAIDMVGLKKGSVNIAAIGIGSYDNLNQLKTHLETKWNCDDSVLELTPEKLNRLINLHNIPRWILNSSPDKMMASLLCEKAAMLGSE